MFCESTSSNQPFAVGYKNSSPYTEFTVNEFGDIMKDPYFVKWLDEWKRGNTDYIPPTVVFSSLVEKMLIIKGTYRIFLTEDSTDDDQSAFRR